MKETRNKYIVDLANLIFKHDYDFFLSYAPGTLTQFANPLKKFDDLKEEQKELYLKAAKAAFDVCAPTILKNKEASEPDQSSTE
jgi:hypothetical protein